MKSSRTVLVTGATGYIGSRLIPALLDAGHTVIAASRSADALAEYPWSDAVTHREFDVTDDDLVASAVKGVDAVVYLVHSMESSDFEKKDREAAERVATAAADAGVERIVYLSGLVPHGQLSEHLKSRLEVEQVMLDSPVPAIVLRAAMVVGSGSTSYELLRRLSERVPFVTPVPSWMNRKIQPIAVQDVVHLIARALVVDEPLNEHYDVGGDDVMTYPELLDLFAEVAGLQRTRVPVPWVPQKVVGIACAQIARMDTTEVTTLIESLRHDMVCEESSVRDELLEDDYTFLDVAEALRCSLRTDGPPGTARGADPQAAAPTDQA